MPFGLLGYLADDALVKRDMRGVLEARLQKSERAFFCRGSKTHDADVSLKLIMVMAAGLEATAEIQASNNVPPPFGSSTEISEACELSASAALAFTTARFGKQGDPNVIDCRTIKKT